MQTQLTFSILFWIKKNRIKNGKGPIYARVTINGNRIEISTQREASVFEWNAGSQTARGKSNEAKMLNFDLAFIKTKILSCRSRLEARNEIITIESLKKEYTGVIELFGHFFFQEKKWQT